MRKSFKPALTLVLAFCLGALLFNGVQAIAAAIEASPSNVKVQIDGEEAPLEAYNIGGNNYFKLRDLAAALDIGIWWEEEARTIHLDTDLWYDPDYGGPEYQPGGNAIFCEIGQTYQTSYLDFKIHAINKVESYAGYIPAEGNALYDVMIIIKNNYYKPIPCGTYDWVMDEATWPEYIWPLDPHSAEMMPEEYVLGTNQKVQYHMVFEVPDLEQGLQLHYRQIDEDGFIFGFYIIQIN